MAHTKLQPLKLKDDEDIGWCVRNARGALGFHRTVRALLGVSRSYFCIILQDYAYIDKRGEGVEVRMTHSPHHTITLSKIILVTITS